MSVLEAAVDDVVGGGGSTFIALISVNPPPLTSPVIGSILTVVSVRIVICVSAAMQKLAMAVKIRVNNTMAFISSAPGTFLWEDVVL